jgi:hypothetical protein
MSESKIDSMLLSDSGAEKEEGFSFRSLQIKKGDSNLASVPP